MASFDGKDINSNGRKSGREKAQVPWKYRDDDIPDKNTTTRTANKNAWQLLDEEDNDDISSKKSNSQQESIDIKRYSQTMMAAGKKSGSTCKRNQQHHSQLNKFPFDDDSIDSCTKKKRSQLENDGDEDKNNSQSKQKTRTVTLIRIYGKEADKYKPRTLFKAPRAFQLFYRETVPALVSQGLELQYARKRCKAEYKMMDDETKAKWINKVLQNESEYNEKVKRYNLAQKTPNSVISGNEKALLSKHELKIKNKCDGKPEKPPNSGYTLFSKEFLSGKKGLVITKRMQELSKHWKGLSDKKREQYKERSNRLKCDYKIQYAAYLERLDPVQRLAEVTGSIKTLKRVTANKKTEEQPVVKKRKLNPKEGVLASKSQDPSLPPAKRHSFAALMRKGEKEEELSDFNEETSEDQSGQTSVSD